MPGTVPPSGDDHATGDGAAGYASPSAHHHQRITIHIGAWTESRAARIPDSARTYAFDRPRPPRLPFLARSTGPRWQMDVSQARTLHILAQPRRLREDMESRRVRVIAIHNTGRHNAGRHDVGRRSTVCTPAPTAGRASDADASVIPYRGSPYVPIHRTAKSTRLAAPAFRQAR